MTLACRAGNPGPTPGVGVCTSWNIFDERVYKFLKISINLFSYDKKQPKKIKDLF